MRSLVENSVAGGGVKRSVFICNAFLYAIIFVSGSPLFEGAEKVYVLLLSVLMVIVFRGRRLEFSRQSIFIFLVLTLLILVFPIINDLNYGRVDRNTVGFWLSVSLSFFIASLIPKDEFILLIEKLMVFLLLPGLIVWTVVQIVPALVLHFPKYTYGGFSHYTLYFVNFLVHDEVSARFAGFASEPGLAQVFYTIALYSRLSRNGSRVDWIVLVLCLAIFLTRSTAGIFSLAVLLLVMLPLRKSCKTPSLVW